MGEPRVKQKANNNTLRFSFDSEIPPVIPLKLKIEINCREHFSVMGYKNVQFSVNNDWFSKEVSLITYHLSEMAGTKLRALYQRKKGRDLFDLYKILDSGGVHNEEILRSYNAYMNFGAATIPSRKEYQLNLESKLKDYEFTHDMQALLPPGKKYDISRAYEKVLELIDLM